MPGPSTPQQLQTSSAFHADEAIDWLNTPTEMSTTEYDQACYLAAIGHALLAIHAELALLRDQITRRPT